MTGRRLSAYLVDDEPLALRRLARLLEATGRVEVEGSETDPARALVFLRQRRVDVLFLDIQMPGMNGFEMLAQLGEHPPVVFTTAYDQYALRAFEVNSIDYLLKPIEAGHLARALDKMPRLRGEAPPDLRAIVEQLASGLRSEPHEYPTSVASRLGERVQLVELDRVTHFFASDKLTYAATAAKDFVVDATIADLEQRLDPKRFLRIHRSILLNLAYVREVHTSIAGRYLVRLKDDKRTELTVARDRVRALRDRLGF